MEDCSQCAVTERTAVCENEAIKSYDMQNKSRRESFCLGFERERGKGGGSRRFTVEE